MRLPRDSDFVAQEATVEQEFSDFYALALSEQGRDVNAPTPVPDYADVSDKAFWRAEAVEEGGETEEEADESEEAADSSEYLTVRPPDVTFIIEVYYIEALRSFVVRQGGHGDTGIPISMEQHCRRIPPVSPVVFLRAA